MDDDWNIQKQHWSCYHYCRNTILFAIQVNKNYLIKKSNKYLIPNVNLISENFNSSRQAVKICACF